MMRLIASILAALAVAPAASAWAPVSTVAVPNTMQGSGVRLANGTELFAYSDGIASLHVWSSSGGDREIAKVSFVSEPQVVVSPSGVQLYVGSATGVVRFSSADGETWAGPFQTRATKTGPVEAAAVRADGTPIFAQDSTAGVDVYQGLSGEVAHRAFSVCCGYGESLAVDTANYAQLAFWSNASPFPSQFVYEGLDASGAQAGPGRAFGAPQTAQHADDVPIVADGAGNTFMGWAGGYPSSSSFVVNDFQGGNLRYSTIVAGGTFSGADPHMALATDPASRLWAVWTQGGVVHARRSRSAARHFGAPSAAAVGGSAYQLAAIALASGGVDVFVNDGSRLSHQTFLPALTIKVTKMSVKVTDDGFGVKATLRGGGRVLHTSAAGVAKLGGFRRKTRIVVGAPGYAPASFRTS
jgi:hypothetical protein